MGSVAKDEKLRGSGPGESAGGGFHHILQFASLFLTSREFLLSVANASFVPGAHYFVPKEQKASAGDILSL